MTYDVLIEGFPGRTVRGFLGWSTITLIRAQEGPVLFDTGGAGDRPGLLAALAARGLQPKDIHAVVLSHLHFDHVGNVECFEDARLILHRKELDHALEHGTDDPAIPHLLVRGLLEERDIELLQGENELFAGVRQILTPGHTPGHCSLVLRQEGQVHVLAQDAVKSRAELNSRLANGAMDAAAASASVDRIAAMADVVVPGHDTTLVRSADRHVATRVLRAEILLPDFHKSYVMEI